MFCGLAISSTLGGARHGFDFAFAKGTVTENHIFDSATSPPGRYLLEICRRLRRAAPEADLLVIANPLLPLRASQLSGWLTGRLPSLAVIADEGDFPLFYVLPAQAFDEIERHMMLLSSVDARLDAQLLEVLLGQKPETRRLTQLKIGQYPVGTATGWFQGKERQRILKLLAAHAINIISRSPEWRRLPVAVYHPYHAGSIVFFAAAARDVAEPLFDAHIICSSYRDIHDTAGSPLRPIWLKLPFLPRDASVGEPQYFAAAIDRLGPDLVDHHFIVFNRYSRNTGISPFHRIDQDRFSLGESLDQPSRLRQLLPPLVTRSCALPAEPLSVLFHITGGLPIKNYPLQDARILFRMLTALGIRVSVIGRPDLEEAGARSIDADETDLLAAAVERHHIFVGLDSFPHHFVRNVMGWPTIGLFGTTAATNFGGGWNTHYRTLDAALSCHPCGAEQSCPVFGAPECANYITPTRLVVALLEMAQQLYGFNA